LYLAYLLPLSARLLPGPRINRFPRATGPINGRRIIVTDDNPEKLHGLTRTLRDAGHCVFAAYDGEAGFELVTLLPRIAPRVTNTRLGSVDGTELMRRARDLPRDADPPRGSPGRVPGRRPPDVLTLREPFTPDHLLVAVGSLLA
jgi:CheY-like chemotaxis protein